MTTGYTLPVFACASAIAALRHLHRNISQDKVQVNLIKPAKIVDIMIEQVARIDEHSAIAITRSDPGNHLDLTLHTPVWAKVSIDSSLPNQIKIMGGEGLGRQGDRAAIYSYAQELIQENLQPLLVSNEAFGVLEGLSLLGTTGIVQPLTAPNQLQEYQEQIRAKAAIFDSLVFCIGENGIDLAQKSGVKPQRIIKTANWIGSMLVAAGIAEVKSILLFGYHGKLIKLAGGIFHTHNHLADGRLEILTAYCAKLGLPQSEIGKIFASPTTESALNLLRQLDANETKQFSWVDIVYQELAQEIDAKSEAYIHKYTEKKLCVGSVMFDRQRNIIKKSQNAFFLISKLC